MHIVARTKIKEIGLMTSEKANFVYFVGILGAAKMLKLGLMPSNS
jgi:hypothetical protein